MKKVKNFIDFLECPLVNGIIFPNGVIKLLDVNVEWSPKLIYTIKKSEETSIKALEKIGHLQWNDCAILTKLSDEKKNIVVIAGEGDYGSDGFVSVIDLYSRKLIWLAFFNCSNPFEKLEIKNDELLVKSTNGCLWKFNILDPVNIVVDCC